MPVSKHRLSDFFGKEARNYDDVLQGSPGKEYVARLEMDVFESTIKGHEYKNFLDVGVGTGRFSALLNKLGIFVHGVDIAPEMLAMAREKMQNDNYRFSIADGENLPFDDEYFDGLVSMRVFKYFHNPAKAVSEFSRVLKNRGLFVVQFANRHSYQYFVGRQTCFSKTYSESLNLITLREVKKLLKRNHIKILAVKGTIRVPFFVYARIKRPFILRFLKTVERTMKYCLPGTALYRDFVVIGEKSV